MTINERHAYERDLPKFHVVAFKDDTRMFICLIKPLKRPNDFTSDIDQLFPVDTPNLDTIQQAYFIDASKIPRLRTRMKQVYGHS